MRAPCSPKLRSARSATERRERTPAQAVNMQKAAVSAHPTQMTSASFPNVKLRPSDPPTA
jgi:hypothetical protein